MKRYLLPLLLVAPTALPAQTSTSLSSFVASDGGVSDTPLLVGASLGWERGRLGMRWSVGMDAGSSFAVDSAAAGLLTAEVDGLLLLLSPAGRAPLIPYLLVGAGVRALHEAGATHPVGMWGYGGGFRAPLGSRVALEGEGRYREPLPRDPARRPERVSAGTEFRAGIRLRLGRTAPRPRAPLPPEPVWTPRAPAYRGAGAGARLRLAQEVLGTAERYLGVPYLWGGNTPQSGFDCSGFVRYVFRAHGLELPRVSQDQARAGAPLPLEPSAFEPGDLLAFASKGDTVDHIALYLGDGRIIHSSASGRGVRVDDLRSRRGAWYLRHLVAARRVIPE